MMRAVLATVLGLLGCSLALAQPAPWPAKPIRLVVGFAAGGPTDLVARALAESFSRNLGQPVVVDNRPGANTIIAAEAVANAPPDGYTLLVAATNHTMIPALYADRIRFDALRSFKPICILTAAPTVLVVSAASGIKTLAEFTRRAKAQPGSITYGTPGIGSSVHFASEQFARLAGLYMTHVPYKGAAPAIADVMAGQVTASFASLGSVLPHLKAGKLQALAVAAPQRLASLPEVPTFAESGVPGYSADAWYGLLAPAGLPAPLQQVLEQQSRQFLALQSTSDKLRSLGLEPAPQCGDAFARSMSQEVQTYRSIAQDLNLKAD